MKEKMLRIIPLGGLGEIGKNMMVYEFGGDILVVDSGMAFPENDLLGIDYIIPDIQYLRENRKKVRGIVITHGHEDHLGAIAHVVEELEAPIFTTPLTRGLMEVKLARKGLLKGVKINTVQAGEGKKIGVFQVEFFHVSHSIPDSVGLGIQTPVGLIVHTSDYKFDQTPVDNWPTDFAKLAEFSKRNVLVLLSDSTNSVKPGWTASERVVDGAFEEEFRKAPGRIIIASFASLISRMQQAANAAARHGRKIAFAGTSMIDNAKIARKMGYLDIPDEMFVRPDKIQSIPDDKLVIMCTGTQGEPTSIMGRLSRGTNRIFDLKPDDTVILSSQIIPGNEEKVFQVINRLFQQVANVVYEQVAPVHVSGHASQEEMKLMINLVKPKFFMPIHGELRHLVQHGRLAQQLGIAKENIVIVENGQVVEVGKTQIALNGRVPTGAILIDSTGKVDIEPSIIREREILSREGVVLVNLTVDSATGKVFDDPEIITRGFILAGESNKLFSTAQKEIKEAASRTNNNLQRDVESAVRKYIYDETQRSPYVLVTITKI